MEFTLEATDASSSARAGALHTAHGTIATPIFMPVGTLGTVKALSQQDLAAYVQPDIILANNYHLYLRPGGKVLAAAGGLHKFMHWQGPILTDSGGFQAFSLAKIRKIAPAGITFRSHIDGSSHLFTPENVVEMQRTIGSDVQMVLDECTPYPCDYSYASKSLGLTHAWAARARQHFLITAPQYGHQEFQFGIVQGSTYQGLRQQSAQQIAELDFDGNAIGGLAVGEPPEVMYALTEEVCRVLPSHKPRYLMGVGTPLNILESIARGVDMMDCVLPTRNARHGLIYSWDGIRNLKHMRYKEDFTALDELSTCPIDHYYSKAYVRHLFIAGEYLALTIASIHNLHFFLALVRQARKHIIAGTFASWKAEVMPQLGARH